jgi:hypothetical protein
MIGPSRLNIGDLVRDFMGYHYILIEVLEPSLKVPADPLILVGAPWRYVVSDVTTGGMRTLRFKERALILVRGKNEKR